MGVTNIKFVENLSKQVTINVLNIETQSDTGIQGRDWSGHLDRGW